MNEEIEITEIVEVIYGKVRRVYNNSLFPVGNDEKLQQEVSERYNIYQGGKLVSGGWRSKWADVPFEENK